MSLQDALRTLGEAHGPSALTAAFESLTQAVRRARKASKGQVGTLAATYVEAMRLWDAQRADGVSLELRLVGLEKTLRAAWPQTRAWKYLCDRCQDVGLSIETCPGDATCGRVKPHLAHSVGTPCWCKAGVRFRERPKPEPEPAKARTLTRAGR